MYKLHCFSQSGNAYKVAFYLRAARLDWEPVFVDFMNGATRTPEWRQQHNEMGEVPVLEFGSRQLTQTGVILTYLADTHGQFGGADADQRLEILRWILFDNHKFTSYMATYRFLKSFGPSAPDPTLMAWLRGRLDAAFKVVNLHLAERDYMVGTGPTIADFSLCGYLFYPLEESDYELPERFAHIHAWRERLRQLPGWADPYDILPGARILPKW